MVITLASRRRDKILSFIEQEGWLAPKWATIQELAFVYGLLDNASEFFSWARVHSLNLRSLLADCIRRTYGIAKHSIQVQERVSAAEKVLPRQLHDRLSSMQLDPYHPAFCRHARIHQQYPIGLLLESIP
ncbi:hypothetical protein IV203_017957 [Nitzschia inconspicua]|uniref:Uncharacterized protein n=1 Tax=Nitzschia inconspicua TaxID=303405 RepID=A0A9K3Q619_9STRA|nr:hypothetical protein IV203_017957 [Nitzschia inconspicua]